jgi:hypothetical protein
MISVARKDTADQCEDLCGSHNIVDRGGGVLRLDLDEATYQPLTTVTPYCMLTLHYANFP